MSDWPQEVRKVLVLNNLRDPFARFRARKPSAQKRRPTNSRAHLHRIRRQPCLVLRCDTGAIVDPHHLKSGEARFERAFGRRSTDQFAIPLCRIHHEEIEGWPGACEWEWCWEITAVDCFRAARELWKASDPLLLDREDSDYDAARFNDMLDVMRRLHIEAARTMWLRDQTERARLQREGARR